MARKQRRSIRSRTLENKGIIVVRTIHDRAKAEEIADASRTFGGQPYVRIYRDRFRGSSKAVVSLRYTNYRATVGELHPEIVSDLRWTLFWAALRSKVITAPATIDTDPNSSTYLDIRINAQIN